MPLTEEAKRKKAQKDATSATTLRNRLQSQQAYKNYQKKQSDSAATAAKTIKKNVQNGSQYGNATKKSVTNKSDSKYGSTTKGRGLTKTETAYVKQNAKKVGKTVKAEAKKMNVGKGTDTFKTVHKQYISNGTTKIGGGNERSNAYSDPTLAMHREKVYATDPGAKFMGNFVESLIDNSAVAVPYTMSQGKKLSQSNFLGSQYYNANPSKQANIDKLREKSHQGFAAGAGRMAGMAVDYGLARGLMNPVLDKATDAIMNGTRVGEMIKGSATLGKIGQSLGTPTAQNIGRGLVKETLSDATLGFGQNALLNYGEGLRGEDFWRQQAADTALDFLVGGMTEGIPIGRQIRQAGKEARKINGINVSDILNSVNTKDEYLDVLGSMGRDLKGRSLDDVGRNLKNATSTKGSELTSEYRKVLNMTDDEFARYKFGGGADTEPVAREAVEPVEEVVEPQAAKPANREVRSKSGLSYNRNKNAEGRYNAYGEKIGGAREAERLAKEGEKTYTYKAEEPEVKTEAKVETKAKAETKAAKTVGKKKQTKAKKKVEEPTKPKQEEMPLAEKAPEVKTEAKTEAPAKTKAQKQTKAKTEEISFDPKNWRKELDEKGETWLGHYGHLEKKADGTYNLFVNGVGDKEMTRKQALDYIRKSVKKLADEEDNIRKTRVSPLTEQETARVKEIDSKIKSIDEEGKAKAQKLKDNKYKGLDEYTEEAGKRGHEANKLQHEKDKILNKEPEPAKAKTEPQKGKPLETKAEKEVKKERVDSNSNKSRIRQALADEKDIKLTDEQAKLLSKGDMLKVHNGELSLEDALKGAEERRSARSLATKDGKLKVNDKMSKAQIAEKFKKAGRELSDEVYEKASVNDLIALGKGEIDEAAILGKTKQRVAQEYLDLEKYDKIYNSSSHTADNPKIQKKLIDEYVNDMKSIGRPLSKDEIAELRGMDVDDAYQVIEANALDNASKKYGREIEDIDDYLLEKKRQKYGINFKNLDEAEDYEWDLADAKTLKKLNEKYGTNFKSLDEVEDYEIKKGIRAAEEDNAAVGLIDDDYTTTYSGGEGSTSTFTATTTGKELPKKTQKGKPKKYASMKELPKQDKVKSRAKKGKEKLEKAAEFKVESKAPSSKVETGAPKEKTLRDRWHNFKKKLTRDVLDSSYEFKLVDKSVNGESVQNAYKMTQGTRSQAAHQLKVDITDRQGKKLHDSFESVFKDFDGHMDDIGSYMYYKHEAELALQSNSNRRSLTMFGFDDDETKNAVSALTTSYPALKKEEKKLIKWIKEGMPIDDTYRGFNKKYEGFDNAIQEVNKYKAEQAQKIVAEFEKDPKFLATAQKFETAYNKWFDEWAVKSGLISEDTVKEWRGKYKYYIPTFRVQDVGSGAMKTLDSPDMFHSIRGQNKAKLLGIEDQIGVQVSRVTRACRKNELNLSILDAIRKNPDAGYGRILSVSDASAKDIDEVLSKIGSSTENLINGGKTITVFENGKAIKMEVSDDLRATLQAVEMGAETGTIARLGKAVTNPIKMGITGANPLFIVSNALRDTVTALIQSEHGMGKTVAGWGKAIAGMAGKNNKYSEFYKQYKFGGAELAGYYIQGKGFDTSAVLHTKGFKGTMNKIGKMMTFFGEMGETIPRFGEFINTMEKTGGDFYKSMRSAAEVTVDFSKKGASDGMKTLDAWTLYLNAGMQGLKKFAETMAEHPVRTTARTALVIGGPYMALSAINNDNPWYWELSDRTRQNYFCIPSFFGEKDEDGNCKEFIRLPMNREYGAIMGASLDAIWRGVKGEKNFTSGIGTTLSENFLPSNPITDNVLAPLLINIPSNRDYKGAKILTNSEYDDFKAGKNADLQYDAKTSGAALGVSKLANEIMGESNIPILKYLKSPKLVDYVLDSYGGYYGSLAQSGTQQGINNPGDVARNVLVKPFTDKFSADPRYSSRTMDEAYDKIAELKADQKRAASQGKEWSEAHASYRAADAVMQSYYDTLDAEKAIKSDSTLSESEKKKQINELREARLKMVSKMDEEIAKAKKEYEEAPTYSWLYDSVKENYNPNLGMSKEEWAKAYKASYDENRKRKDETGKGISAYEKRWILMENGVKTYEQAQSLLGQTTSKDQWDIAKKAYDNGKTLAEVQAEAKAMENMSDDEKNFVTYFKNRADSRYDGKTISKETYDKYLEQVKYVDQHNPKKESRNGSIDRNEAYTAILNMKGLTKAQRAYLWKLSENVDKNGKGWKWKPFG